MQPRQHLCVNQLLHGSSSQITADVLAVKFMKERSDPREDGWQAATWLRFTGFISRVRINVLNKPGSDSRNENKLVLHIATASREGGRPAPTTPL